MHTYIHIHYEKMFMYQNHDIYIEEDTQVYAHTHIPLEVAYSLPSSSDTTRLLPPLSTLFAHRQMGISYMYEYIYIYIYIYIFV